MTDYRKILEEFRTHYRNKYNINFDDEILYFFVRINEMQTDLKKDIRKLPKVTYKSGGDYFLYGLGKWLMPTLIAAVFFSTLFFIKSSKQYHQLDLPGKLITKDHVQYLELKMDTAYYYLQIQKKKNKMMKNMTTKAVIGFITLSLLILSSCGKKDNNTRIQKKEAIMRMEVACKGDLQSQVAVLSFLATNSQRDLLNIVNDSTGVITAGPFLQNSDFLDHRLISFHSEKKLSSVSIQLAISPKVYATSQDQTFSMTIKIFFDGKLKDNQTFFYDQLYGSAFTTPKDFDYKVEVNQ